MEKAALDHDRLVQRIYDGADEPRGLEDALIDMAAEFGAEKAQLLVIENGTELFEHRFHGAPESTFFDFFANWKDKDPRFAESMARPGVVLSDIKDIDRPSFEQSEVFNEHLVPANGYYAMFGNFPTGSDLVMASAFIRGRNDRPFDVREIAKLTALIPHLRRTTRLRYLMQSMRDELDDLRRALDVLPSAVAILDHSGKVVCANTFAEALFRERNGIRTERGKLTASTPNARRELAAAILQLAGNADAGAHRPLVPAVVPTVFVPLGQPSAACSLTVMLFALRPRSELRERTARAARVLAVIHDPRRIIRLSPAVVAQVHGLTSTEAALASALAEGQTVADFAVARGCTEQTARTHLKHILDKTGTRRQADLVRVLLTGAAVHAFK